MPAGWTDAVAVLAHLFHFQPSELLAMDDEDLHFWMGRALWVSKNHG